MLANHTSPTQTAVAFEMPQFETPMLQLIASTPGLPPVFQRVADKLTEAFSEQFTRAQRVEAASDLESVVRLLELDSNIQGQMLLEAWKALDEPLASPVIWEKLALQTLRAQEIKFGRWLEAVIPEFERTWEGAYENPVLMALKTPMKIMLGMPVETFIDTIEEAQAAVRLLRLYACEHDSKATDEETGLTSRQLVALGLWETIEARMRVLTNVPAGETSSQKTSKNSARKSSHPGGFRLEVDDDAEIYGTAYGPTARHTLTMHLLGKAQAVSAQKEGRRTGAFPGLTGVTTFKGASGGGTPGADTTPVSTDGIHPSLLHIVVKGVIPPPSVRDEKELAARYESLRSPLRLPAMPSADTLATIIATLQSEFPWATRAVEQMGRQLLARQRAGSLDLAWSPMLLVGLPGCGKSRLSRRMAQLLELPFLPMDLAGAHDPKMLLGTSRGWSTAQPSALLQFLQREGTGRAVVLLDEVDKISHLSDGASLSSVLLNLLEPETSRRWYDNFLQTPCDLSKLLYIATANSLSPLSSPLLSRLQPVLVPEPQRVHFLGVAKAVLADIASEWGVPVEALDDIDIPRIARHANNVRQMRAMVTYALAEQAGTARQLH